MVISFHSRRIIEMIKKNEKIAIIIAAAIIGVIASMLVVFGNPANMGFCIACFLRDTSGALGLHKAEPVQYIRPEIIGLVLGSFVMALWKKEFSAKGGSAPVTRFVLGAFAMIGCLMFLGCPFRTVLRLAGGDLNAIWGLIGFALGIGVGIIFLNKGYSLKRTYKQKAAEGFVFPIVQVAMLVLVIVAPSIIMFTPEGGGPGAKHAAIIISLIAGLIVGALAQRTRLCMVGGIRDFILFRESKLLIGFVVVFASALICNLILTSTGTAALFNLGFEGQPVAHTDALWNALGMILAGFACTLLGGCPLRQLVLSGEGNTDSVVTVLGLMAGAAFAHNFKLASSADGPTTNGKIAVVVGLMIVLVIAIANTIGKDKE